jgi:hypothetical protein
MPMKKDREISRTRLRRHRVLTAISKYPNQDHVVSQRNMLVGLWAGTLLGLSGERRAIYALEVMAAGLMKPEPGDVVDKVANDFMENGVSIGRSEILVQVSTTHHLVDRLGKAIH